MSDQGPLPGSEPSVPLATVRRLSLYLRQLQRLSVDGETTISSRRLGLALGLSDAQVRKDLAYFGQFGRAGVGYGIDGLSQAIQEILGIDQTWSVALIGLGNLGRALIGYRGFQSLGFRIEAVFDQAPALVGTTVAGMLVQDLQELKAVVDSRRVLLGMIAVPADAAQFVADLMVAAGIVGILNFAPIRLNIPAGVSVVSVDLATQLETLSYQVKASGILGGL